MFPIVFLGSWVLLAYLNLATLLCMTIKRLMLFEFERLFFLWFF